MEAQTASEETGRLRRNHVWLATRQVGVPWQIVPETLPRLLADPDPTVSARAFAAMNEMVKLDIAALEQAAAG